MAHMGAPQKGRENWPTQMAGKLAHTNGGKMAHANGGKMAHANCGKTRDPRVELVNVVSAAALASIKVS